MSPSKSLPQRTREEERSVWNSCFLVRRPKRDKGEEEGSSVVVVWLGQLVLGMVWVSEKIPFDRTGVWVDLFIEVRRYKTWGVERHWCRLTSFPVCTGFPTLRFLRGHCVGFSTRLGRPVLKNF